MKKFVTMLVGLLLVFLSRGQERKLNTVVAPSNTSLTYMTYGKASGPQNAIGVDEISETYANLSMSDTVHIKFRATVTDVCKAKGCWMKLELEDGKETMVRFKDYGFFMPMDIEGREVVVNGKAFVSEMSIEDQKHYAKDGGQTELEIAKFKEAKKTYGFEADGVLLVNE